MASISSSQNGGLASNEPLTGQKDRKGLKHMPDCYAGTGRVDRLCSGVSSCVTSPSGPEEAVGVREGGAKLFEVAVEWRGKALERNTKLTVQRLKHRHRQRPLQATPLVSTTAEHHLHAHTHLVSFEQLMKQVNRASTPSADLVSLQEAPDSGQELVEARVVYTAVPVQQLLQRDR